jgi:acetyl-CoA C-acetyltransferase
MQFRNAAIPVRLCWSSPFVRWQGALADVSSLELAASVTAAALEQREIRAEEVDGIVLGLTVPQPHSFYGPPWLASRLGFPNLGGTHIAQACATSVACVSAAAQQVELDGRGTQLVIATDRTSNGPLLVYPRSQSMGGSPALENWVLDSFAADPNTGHSMVVTAENVAADGGMSRTELDDLTLLRWAQYQTALAEDRAIQRRYLQPVCLPQGKGRTLVVEADEGIYPYTREGLAALRPVQAGGLVTFGTQTHPAEGCAGAFVPTVERAKALAGQGGTVARILSVGSARAGLAHMPKAATTAAQAALADAGIEMGEVKYVVTHNPFAVNDAWFARQTGFPLERMNPYGCSLIYGHPQGPTGLRGIIELIHALHAEGGGIGMFTGCAAGDIGAAMVIKVDEGLPAWLYD